MERRRVRPSEDRGRGRGVGDEKTITWDVLTPAGMKRDRGSQQNGNEWTILIKQESKQN